MVEGDLFQDGVARDRDNLKSTLSSYLSYWYVFVLSIGICLVVAFFHLRYTVQQYFVSTSVLIKDHSKESGELSSSGLAEIQFFQPTKKIEDEIIVLKSKSLMERVLRELSLNTSYYLEGRLQDMEVHENVLPLKVIVNELYAGAFNKKIFIYPKDDNSFELGEIGNEGKTYRYTYRFGQQIKRPYAVFTVIARADSASVPTNEKVIVVFHDFKQLAGAYSNKLSVAPVNKMSNVVQISLIDPVAHKGIDILQKLIEVYKSEAIEDKNVTASSTLNFIDERLRYLTAEITNVEKNVEQYKRQNNLTDVSSDAALYLKSADDYNKKLAEFDIQLELLRSIEDYLQDKGSSEVNLVPSSLNIQDPTLLVLISKFNELQLERQRMQRTMHPSNPLMVNINDQVNNLRINIGENIRNLENGLIITRQNLVASSAKFEHRKRMVPAMERELLEISRQQGVKEGLYLYLLEKREESALSLAATVSSFRIIDPPGILYPVKPNAALLFVIALFAGFAMPIGIIYLKNLLNDKVMQVKDIESLTNTPILGEIARHKGKEFIVVSQNNTNPIVEMFRLIRVNLQFVASSKQNKVILITSSISGEGKSFFSVNFAASLVLTGKRVVVLGMDLRKPSATKNSKIPDELGITNFLVSDSVFVSDVVKASNLVPNLFIVGSGPISPSPTELMMSPRMGVLIETLRSSFDYVIIDSAPIGLVADAFTLAPYIDSTIYLVRRNYTPKERLSLIDKIYKERRLPFPMIVFNDTLIAKDRNYGYGYGYTEKPTKRKPVTAVDKKNGAIKSEVVSIK